MKQQERERLQGELLEITGFRQVLNHYYFTVDAMNWWFWLDPHLSYDRPAFCDVGSHILGISALRERLCDLGSAGVTAHASHDFYDLAYFSIKYTASLHLFQLIEKAQDDKDKAPPSLKQLADYLELPESKKIIEKLCGNTKNNLDSLAKQIDKLWEEYGESAYVFRNHLVHGRITMLDPDSKAWRESIGNEQSSKDFYKTLEGIYEILNFASKSFFGEKGDLPNYKEFAEAVFDGRKWSSIWCFDENKFPYKFDSSDFPDSVLRDD